MEGYDWGILSVWFVPVSFLNIDSPRRPLLRKVFSASHRDDQFPAPAVRTRAPQLTHPIGSLRNNAKAVARYISYRHSGKACCDGATQAGDTAGLKCIFHSPWYNAVCVVLLLGNGCSQQNTTAALSWAGGNGITLWAWHAFEMTSWAKTLQ